MKRDEKEMIKGVIILMFSIDFLIIIIIKKEKRIHTYEDAIVNMGKGSKEMR